MMRSVFTLAAASVAAAQTWYGAAPDDTIPGQVNLFEMSANGVPGRGVASVVTGDDEYVKSGTLHCLWNTPVCFFLTGVGARYTQDYIYAVNRTDGRTLYKDKLPEGIYLDNLAMDWETDTLYSVAFVPQRGTELKAAIVSFSGVNGKANVLLDITKDVEVGFIFEGSVSICPTTKTLFVGVQSLVRDGTFPDYFVAYDYSTATPKKSSVEILGVPIPSAVRALCNATTMLGYFGDIIFSASEDRETLVLGDLLKAGREGEFFPIAKGDLPSVTQRGDIPLHLNGMLSEFDGLFLIPVFPPFTRGPGPAPSLPGGLLYTYQFPQPGHEPRSELTPIDYYLAGASGVPGK